MIEDNLFGMGEILFNFNRDNVKIYVSKSSAYAGGYELSVRAICSNEKLKEVAKLEKRKKKSRRSCISDYNPAFSQLRFFLLSLGIPTNRMDAPSRKMDKRASKGIKGIQLNYYFQDPALAYALGLDLTSFCGGGKLPNTKEEIINREEHLGRVISNLQNLQFENRQKCEQESKITQVDAQKIWEDKYKELWIKELDKARYQGIAFHLFNSNLKRCA